MTQRARCLASCFHLTIRCSVIVSFAVLGGVRYGAPPLPSHAGDIDLDGDGEISYEEFRQMMEEENNGSTPYTSAATSAATSGTATEWGMSEGMQRDG